MTSSVEMVPDGEMEPLAWLVQRRLQSVLHRDHDWLFRFEDSAALIVSCLWRFIEEERIRLTSEDDGHQFGLPAPVDGAAELIRCVGNGKVDAVVLRRGTLDLELRFETGHVLQIIPDSAGYESWIANDNGKQFIAVGGGELAIYSGQPLGG